MQVPEWIQWYPAVLRKRYWRSVRSVAIGGALTGGLLWVIAYSVSFFVDAARDVDKSDRWTERIDNLHGGDLHRYLLVLFGLGTLLYGARRVWWAEIGGEYAEALEALTPRQFRFGDVVLNGRLVFGIWGGLLLRPHTPLSFIEEMAIQADFQQLVKALDGRTRFTVEERPSDERAAAEAAEASHTKRLNSEACWMMQTMEEWSLVAPDAGQDNVAIEATKFRLTENGKRALIQAKRIARRSKIKLRIGRMCDPKLP